MTDLARLIAQHERDAVCKTCGHKRATHYGHEWGSEYCVHCDERPDHGLHNYISSFDVTEYIQGIRDGQSVESREQQGPLL